MRKSWTKSLSSKGERWNRARTKQLMTVWETSSCLVYEIWQRVKEQLSREDKLTLEKAISMARASEAQKNRLKWWAQRSKLLMKIHLWMTFELATSKWKILYVNQNQGWACKKGGVIFVALLTPGDLLCLAKRVVIAGRKIISRVFA